MFDLKRNDCGTNEDGSAVVVEGLKNASGVALVVLALGLAAVGLRVAQRVWQAPPGDTRRRNGGLVYVTGSAAALYAFYHFRGACRAWMGAVAALVIIALTVAVVSVGFGIDLSNDEPLVFGNMSTMVTSNTITTSL